MKWVAIDLGRNEIKAAVRDIAGKPTKLLYNNNGRIYSYLPSEGYLSKDSRAYVGVYLPIVGALFPEKIKEIKALQNRPALLNALFEEIKEAAILHYNDYSIGVILLYEDVKDDENNGNSPYAIAKSHFTEVQQKCASEVLSSVLYSNEGTSMVIDISMSALKMSLVENGKKTTYFQSDELGFSTIDVSEIIGYRIAENFSEVELYLHGQLFENARMCLCQGKDDVILLDALNVDSDSSSTIKKRFEDSMTRYLFRCFDVCSQNMKKLSKSWNDINNIVCCGSASNYYRMRDTFCEFLRECGTDINALNITKCDNDAQWAAAFNTLQLPLLEESGVIVEF